MFNTIKQLFRKPLEYKLAKELIKLNNPEYTELIHKLLTRTNTVSELIQVQNIITKEIK